MTKNNLFKKTINKIKIGENNIRSAIGRVLHKNKKSSMPIRNETPYNSFIPK